MSLALVFPKRYATRRDDDNPSFLHLNDDNLMHYHLIFVVLFHSFISDNALFISSFVARSFPGRHTTRRDDDNPSFLYFNDEYFHALPSDLRCMFHSFISSIIS